jgi:hypothetical protein
MPHEFHARDGEVRSTAFPGLVQANGTTIPVAGYAFDAASEEGLFFRFRASDYTSGDVAVSLDWYADSASSGAVVWGAQLAAITPDTDTQDVETDALPTTTNVTDTHLGTTGQRLHRVSITLTGAALDSLSANDHAVLRIARVATDGADTMSGDAILLMVSIAA